MLMLSGDLTVLQEPMLDSLAFDPFALFDDGFGPAKVGVGWCHVVEAIAISMLAIAAIRS